MLLLFSDAQIYFLGTKKKSNPENEHAIKKSFFHIWFFAYLFDWWYWWYAICLFFKLVAVVFSVIDKWWHTHSFTSVYNLSRNSRSENWLGIGHQIGGGGSGALLSEWLKWRQWRRSKAGAMNSLPRAGSLLVDDRPGALLAIWAVALLQKRALHSGRSKPSQGSSSG